MQRSVKISALILIALSVSFDVRAQNQPVSAPDPHQSAPVDFPKENQPAPSGNPELTADYPMNQAGTLIRGVQWTVVANQYPTKLKNAHGIAASLSYGMVPVKIVAEYQGEHASAQIDAAQPIICVCHFTSIPGAAVLVRLHSKKDARELDGGRMVVYPVVGNTKMADANKSDLILRRRLPSRSTGLAHSATISA